MKKLLLLTLIAASVSTLQARQLTPGEALNRAAHTGITSAATPSRSGGTKLVYTDVDATTGENGVYVFTHGDGAGFIIVSADDCALPLLGYSDNGTFDPDNIPDNLRAWLSSYTSEIAYASANSSAALPTSGATRPYRAPIAPLCKTKWNQDFPYNNLCPIDDGRRSDTGCVATAMAQILKYHNWPDRGVGSHSYVSKTLKQELSFDFGATTFEWDHMQDTYTSSNSSDFTNNRAVATLLYACGVASDMDYTANGSGAPVKTALNGMINYLKIDKGASIQQRSWYNITEWEDLLYDNLVNCGPIMYYGAVDRYSAHEFVCDGYSKDGYFHINWGWSGMSDGYFLLTALDPDIQGIGGSSGGYNLWQSAVIGICPAKESSEYAQLISSGTNLKGEDGYKTIKVKGSFYNESLVSLDNVVLGVCIDDQFYSGTALSEPLKSGYGVGQYTVNLTNLGEGTYRVYPAFRTSIADWQLMKGSYTTANYFDITVESDGNIKVKNMSPSISLGLDNLKVNTPLSPGKMFNVTATLTNNGAYEFYDEILVILNGGGVPVVLSRVRVDVMPGASEDITVEDFIPDNVASGSYSLMLARIVDSRNIAIGTPIGVSVKASEAADLKITSATIDNAAAVDPEHITFNLVVNNPGGYYYGPLTAYLFPDGAASFDYVKSPSFMIEEGAKDVHLTFTTSFPNAIPLKRYLVNFYYGIYGGDRIIYNAYPTFTIRGESGIGEIDADSEVTAIDIYTTAGVRITTPPDVTDVESLSTSDIPAGVYVLTLTHSDGHRSTMKYLKK